MEMNESEMEIKIGAYEDGPGPVVNSETAAKVGTNPLILEQILDHLSDDDILKYRHVNALWNDVGCQTLVLRESIEISFSTVSTSSNPHEIGLIHKKGNFNQTLQKLTGCLASSKKFPCVEFHFYGMDLQSPELTNFFSLHGNHIKSLSLGLKWQRRRRRRARSFFYSGNHSDDESSSDSSTDDDDNELTSSDEDSSDDEQRHRRNDDYDYECKQMLAFRKLMLEQVPNLESLTLHGVPNIWDNDKNIIFPRPSHLPQLKILQGDLRAHPKFMQEILTAATNLEIFEQTLSIDEDQDLIKIFMNTGKAKVIQFLNLNPSGPNFEFYSQFSVIGPKLREVKMELNFDLNPNSDEESVRKVSIAIFKILESSQKSLIVLKLSSYTGGLPRLLWPRMERVTSLFVDLWKSPENNDDDDYEDNGDDENGGGNVVGSPCPDWSQIFPNLHELVWDDDLGSDHFPFLTLAPTVRCLQLVRQMCPVVLEKLPKMFPNLKKLSMKDVQDFPSICQGVWAFTQLESLYLGMDVDDDCPANSFPHLDAAFTGLSPACCEQLQKKGLDDEGIHHLIDESDRINPSILNLTNLRILGMRLYDFDLHKKKSYNFITRLTGQHAIQHVPQLSVDAYCKSSFSKENASRMVDCVRDALELYSESLITTHNGPLVDQDHTRTLSCGSTAIGW